MSKSFWGAVAAYIVPTFPLAYIWHLSLFADQYRALAIYREEPIIVFGLLSMVFQGFVLAWSFPRLFDPVRNAWTHDALKFGLLFGLLSWSFTTLAVAAKQPMASVWDFVVLETGFTILQFAVVSPLMALTYRGAPRQVHRKALNLSSGPL